MHVILLAAGRSRRMGRSKAMVDVRGAPALETALRDTRDAGWRAVVVLGEWNAAESWVPIEELAALVERCGARWISNPHPERGQSSSLRLGLDAIEAGHDFALLPVDHARVRPATYRLLQREWSRRKPGVEVVVPVYRGRRGHPPLFDRSLRTQFLALADDEPAHGVVRHRDRVVHHVEVDDSAVVRDFDRPEDLLGR